MSHPDRTVLSESKDRGTDKKKSEYKSRFTKDLISLINTHQLHKGQSKS